MRVLVLSCLAVACTYPEKEFDGPFTCVGAPPPTTAAPLVSIAGKATDPSDLAPLAGVTAVLQSASMTPIFTTMTDAMGLFSFSLNTNKTPVSGLGLFASATGRVNTYYYPSRSVTEDLAITLALLSPMQATNVSLGATGAPPVAGDGTILLTINDCNGLPLSGATLAASAGTVVYFTGIQPTPGTTATDSGGVAVVANVPPGKVTLTATAMGNVFKSRDFTVVADTFIQTEIQP